MILRFRINDLKVHCKFNSLISDLSTRWLQLQLRFPKQKIYSKGRICSFFSPKKWQRNHRCTGCNYAGWNEASSLQLIPYSLQKVLQMIRLSVSRLICKVAAPVAYPTVSSFQSMGQIQAGQHAAFPIRVFVTPRPTAVKLEIQCFLIHTFSLKFPFIKSALPLSSFMYDSYIISIYCSTSSQDLNNSGTESLVQSEQIILNYQNSFNLEHTYKQIKGRALFVFLFVFCE